MRFKYFNTISGPFKDVDWISLSTSNPSVLILRLLIIAVLISK